MPESFDSFFQRATGFPAPYDWQREVALHPLPDVIAVETGFGKTEGAVLGWSYRTLVLEAGTEGRRLVYCLPMRTLVRQTRDRVAHWFARLGAPFANIPVVALAGGLEDGNLRRDWMEHPEEPQVLIGTQDQLLSGALGRGYAMKRFAWPVALGLLNDDVHWIIDETQLMGTGLYTTAQLDWLRRARFGTFAPAGTTWMSATLGRRFLRTIDRQADLPIAKLRVVELGDVGAQGKQRLAAMRPIVSWDELARQDPKPAKGRGTKAKAAKASKSAKGKVERVAPTPPEIAAAALAEHRPKTLTLIIANTVDRAQAIFEAVHAAAPTNTILLTSRFRLGDRREHEKRLDDFEARRKKGQLNDDPGLLCVATQVVEAGVDISATRLFSDLAPWPSIVQRLGRLNRDGTAEGASATFYWGAIPEKKDERVGPYLVSDLERAEKLLAAYAEEAGKRPAREVLAQLSASAEARAALEQEPLALVRARDVYNLFDNEPDIRGGFVDVSRFVRDADPEVDVSVFWREWPDDDKRPPPADADGPPVSPEERCGVGVFALRKYVDDTKIRAWRWDDRRSRWVALAAHEIMPGMEIMLAHSAGGYTTARGWTGRKSDRLTNLAAPPRPEDDADDRWSDDRSGWVTLPVHLRDAEKAAEALVQKLSLPDAAKRAVIDAARLHDLGKALPQWQAAVLRGRPEGAEPLAKSPCLWSCKVPVEWKTADRVREALGLPDTTPVWPLNGKNGLWIIEQREPLKSTKHVRVRRAALRPGMRHEAASALAMWRAYRTAATPPYAALAVYLTACHHGKTRTVLAARRADGRDVAGLPRQPTSLVLEGKIWELDFEIAGSGLAGRFDGDTFVPTSAGWSGLVAELLGDVAGQRVPAGALPLDGDGATRELHTLGPFRLAFLEALVRAADVIASQAPSAEEVRDV